MPDVRRRLRRLLPQGTAAVGVGLLVLGASSYVFLTASARALGPARFADVSVLYVLVFTVGPGLFLPLEQELARGVADRSARGVGVWPVVLRVGQISGLAALAMMVVALVTAPQTVPRLFDGSRGLLAALVGSTAALWLAYLTRGVLAGLTRFRAYGWQLGIEGGLRAVGVIALALSGVRAPGWYGALLAAPIALSVLATGRDTVHDLGPGPVATWQEVSGALGWLLVGSLGSQLLINAGPLMAKLLADSGERAVAGQLLAGLVLSRLPLFAFAAVQAALLPGLAAELAAGRVDEFAAGLRRLVLGAAVLGVLTTAGMALIGPALLHLLFGRGYSLGRLVLVEFAVGSGLFMLCVIIGQALVALRRYDRAAYAWAAGATAFFVVAAIGQALVTRVAVGFLVGVGACLAALVVFLRAAVAGERAAALVDLPAGGTG